MVVIDGKQYEREDLTDEQAYIVDQIRDLNTKQERAQFDLDQCRIASEAFTKILMDSLSRQEASEDQVETVEAVEE